MLLEPSLSTLPAGVETSLFGRNTCPGILLSAEWSGSINLHILQGRYVCVLWAKGWEYCRESCYHVTGVWIKREILCYHYFHYHDVDDNRDYNIQNLIFPEEKYEIFQEVLPVQDMAWKCRNCFVRHCFRNHPGSGALVTIIGECPGQKCQEELKKCQSLCLSESGTMFILDAIFPSSHAIVITHIGKNSPKANTYVFTSPQGGQDMEPLSPKHTRLSHTKWWGCCR